MSTESISVICENETEEFGTVRVVHWPEGLVLWVGGRSVWKSWQDKAEQGAEPGDPYTTSSRTMTDVNRTEWMLNTVVAKKADGTPICLGEVLRTHRWRQGMLLVANNKEVDRRREAEAQVRAWAMQHHGASASISLALRAGQRMANLLREFVKHIPAAQAALDDWNIQVWGKK